jgi:hypothetical protein
MEELKFSIVTPTMWRFAPFLNFLSDIIDLEQVGEVIIINNDVKATPKHEVLYHPKIRLHNLGKNIYVNPAFNFGVAVSRYERICILTDDVIFDIKLFSKISKVFKLNQFYNISYDVSLGIPVTGTIDFVPWHEGIAGGNGGSLMFIHKSDWIDIPAGLDICYGDNWLNDIMQTRFKQNFLIKNTFFYTPMCTTSSSFTNDEMLWREGKIYEAVFRRFRDVNGYSIVPGCTVLD